MFLKITWYFIEEIDADIMRGLSWTVTFMHCTTSSVTFMLHTLHCSLIWSCHCCSVSKVKLQCSTIKGYTLYYKKRSVCTKELDQFRPGIQVKLSFVKFTLYFNNISFPNYLAHFKDIHAKFKISTKLVTKLHKKAALIHQ